MTNTGEEIRELRKEKGLTSRELAERAGISQAYLSQLETGKNDNPSTDVMRRLAKGLDIPFGTFMMLTGEIEDPFDALHDLERLMTIEIKVPINIEITDHQGGVTTKAVKVRDLDDFFYKFYLGRTFFYKGRLLTDKETEKIKKMIQLILED